MFPRALCALGFAVGVCAVVLSSAPASALPVEIDLTITFAPPAGTADWLLDGTADIFLGDASTPTVEFRPGRQKPGTIKIIKEIADPCLVGGICGVSFSFGGITDEDGTGHPTYAFQAGNVPSSDPGSASELFVGNFIPGDPCFNGDTCHATGPIAAFSDPLIVGTWDVTIQQAITAVPEPATLPMFIGAAGALALLVWPRKRAA